MGDDVLPLCGDHQPVANSVRRTILTEMVIQWNIFQVICVIEDCGSFINYETLQFIQKNVYFLFL